MKATGIGRRIDDLGRIVVPKDIRRTLRIREGAPLEIYTDKDGEIVLKMCIRDRYYTIPFGQAVVRREGTDVTIVANLLMMYHAIEAAAILEEEGISCEVIDPRTLVPFDYDTVYESVTVSYTHLDVYKRQD